MSARDGKPCIKCGSNEWYKSGDCAPCDRDKSRKWREANPGKNAAMSRRWREANPGKYAASRRRYYRANSNKIIDWQIRYTKDNPRKTADRHRRYARANLDKRKALANNRRTKKTSAGGSYTAAEWEALVDHYDGKCLCCGRVDVKLTADHITPVSRGGTSNIDNIQPLCSSCNSSKGAKTIDYRPNSGLGRWIQRKLFG